METTAPSRAKEFRALLGRNVLIADGAMGTMLHSKGVPISQCCDELNLSAPDLVREVHREYAAAGSEILETNTFGANRIRLRVHGHAEKLRAINHAGVRIAREAAGDRAFVAGAVGPMGCRITQPGPYFREQVQELVEAGVDLLILETFCDPTELREAAFAARDVAGPEIVLLAQVTPDARGSLKDGTGIAALEQFFSELPVDAIGCNCTAGPEVTLENIKQMMKFSSKPISAMPNAGVPASVNGRLAYPYSSEEMAACALKLLEMGVSILGGCCGTSPEYIRLLQQGRSAVN